MRCAASSVVVQEWIDGDDDDIYFTLFVCDGQARIVALFTGRKMICAPPLVGSTALCVAATEEHQALAAQTQAFVTHSHYHGIGGLEFKRHRRTGEFVVVEPTVGRADWQQEIATLCGVNIPAIAYRTALGEPVESLGAIDPAVAWRDVVQVPPSRGCASTWHANRGWIFSARRSFARRLQPLRLPENVGACAPRGPLCEAMAVATCDGTDPP